ncbi:DUF4983 domain-containing protein [Pedobacter punctiformis]|uniref:DUF4983 domain-containing protein n=1 Tax=Pedobacter punctiformis TaxID=3004097 RepID=A0ABT4LCI0_9SPHI|nr:DUF4983 domain-containing protein [Pedobacter sp. HCMS5-2]MCZ4244863.1 DUF4983 domain-containing protein [Pedobacter sp. HCMS5-2]
MKNLEKNTATNVFRSLTAAVCLAFVLLFGSSCNKDFPNTLNTNYKNDTTGINNKTRKVLYIIMDGVRGKALRALNPPVLAQIVKKSIYAYDGLTDYQTSTMTNATAWSNMITGVTSDKHKVTTENFSGNQIASFPSLFTRFRQTNPNLRSVSIAASKIFNDNLAKDATVTLNYENDDAKVKDGVIEEFKKDDAGIVVAQFHSAEVAGAASGYTDASTNYINAIKQQDTYIGEIMTALQGRKTFASEDWLVVIASNKGGVIPAIPNNPDKTVYADDTRNNFIIFYNPRFVSQFVPKPDSDKLPYSGAAPNFTGTNSAFSFAKLPNATIGNFGTGDFTFQCKIRYDGPASNYPSFISKRASFTAGVPGWVLFLEGDIFQLNMSQVGQGNTQVSGGTIRDGIWHSIAFKVWMNGSVRTVTMYKDGVKGLDKVITNVGNFDSPAPLTLGGNFISGEGGTIDLLIKEVAMFNVAIPDAAILANMRKTTIDATFPNYNNLVGYWPANEGGGSTLADLSGKAGNFTMSSTAKWKTFTDFSPNLDPTVSEATYMVVPNNVDIPFQIYTWMGVIIQPSWQLKGKSWKPNYTDVRI